MNYFSYEDEKNDIIRTRQECPECKKYSCEQWDNFDQEMVATLYKCQYCLKYYPFMKRLQVKVVDLN